MSYQLPSSFLQTFKPKEIHLLKNSFKQFDEDCAAIISIAHVPKLLLDLDEHHALLTERELQRLRSRFAWKFEGRIAFTEFVALIRDLRNGDVSLHNEKEETVGETQAVDAGSAASEAPRRSFAKVQWPPQHMEKGAVEEAPAPPLVRDGAMRNTTKCESEILNKPTEAKEGKGYNSVTQSPWANSTIARWTLESGSAKVSEVKSGGGSIASQSRSQSPWSNAASQKWPAEGSSTGNEVKSDTKEKGGMTAAERYAQSSQRPAVIQSSKATADNFSTFQASQENLGDRVTNFEKPKWPPTSDTKDVAPRRLSVSANMKPSAQWPPSEAYKPTQKDSASTDTTSNINMPINRNRKPSWPIHGKNDLKNPANPSFVKAIPLSGNRARSRPADTQSKGIIHEVRSTAGGVHSYAEEEKIAFTEHINNCLSHDPDVAHLLPISPEQDGLFESVIDGILLCKLLNEAVPETIDTRAINIATKKSLNVYEMTENQNLCINAAKSIGCSVINVGPMDLIEGKPILVLGLVWQIIKLQLTSRINLKNHPELVRLLYDGESLEEFIKLPPDQILLRWMNYHLKAAGHSHSVENFSTDVQDATAYSVLLNRIAPEKCDLCKEKTAEDRAAHVIQNARVLGVEIFIKALDITSGNPKLNMSFVAQLFNTCPALDIVASEIKELEEILYDDIGDTREERVFRMWINSMGIDNLYINHLFSDVRDGIALLKVFDKIENGVVDWSQVHLLAPNTFQKVENCNHCVILGKGSFNFSLVNIGGADIYQGNKKLILSIMWQSMRYQQLKLLSSLSQNGGKPISDADIIDWANTRVESSGRNMERMFSFRDTMLADGLFLLTLVHALEPRAVNWDQVAGGQTDEEICNNAKYVISCAQKIGATVYLTYEDIVEVKPKMIATLVASLMSIDLKIAHS